MPRVFDRLCPMSMVGILKDCKSRPHAVLLVGGKVDCVGGAVAEDIVENIKIQTALAGRSSKPRSRIYQRYVLPNITNHGAAAVPYRSQINIPRIANLVSTAVRQPSSHIVSASAISDRQLYCGRGAMRCAVRRSRHLRKSCFVLQIVGCTTRRESAARRQLDDAYM